MLLALFSLLWWAFSDGSSEQLWFGLIVVIVATGLTLRVPVKNEFLKLSQVKAFIQFIPYFIYESVRGGLLVSRLVLLPERSVRPYFVEYKTRLPKEASLARMWFAATICIFPGTLSCGYKENILSIHVVDTGIFDEKSIQELEGIIEAIFLPGARDH